MDFVRMMQRDILRVVDAVAPSDGTGAANVKVVRRVLANLQQKSVLMPETVQEIEACLNERDTLPGGGALSPISPNATHGGLAAGRVGADGSYGQSQDGKLGRIEGGKMYVGSGGGSGGGGSTGGGAGNFATGGSTASGETIGTTRLDKRQIEQRIEEDRERHKRLRESIWAVGDTGDGEYVRLWEGASEIEEDDILGADEDGAERKLVGEAFL